MELLIATLVGVAQEVRESDVTSDDVYTAWFREFAAQNVEAFNRLHEAAQSSMIDAAAETYGVSKRYARATLGRATRCVPPTARCVLQHVRPTPRTRPSVTRTRIFA